MQQLKTVRTGFFLLMAGGLMMMGTKGVLAQPPGGGFNMPPDMKAKIEAWKKWRDQHKSLSSLSMTVRGLENLNKDPDTKLNKQQSAKMLTILNTWKTKPTLTDDQAKGVQKQINDILNLKQLNRLNAESAKGMGGGGMRPGGGMGGGTGGGRPGGGGPGGPGGRPGGGPGSPGGPGGPGGFKFPDPPKGGFNPLNADTLPFEQMRPAAKKSMSDFSADLQKQAK